jgi:hypothetical protein
MIAGQQTSDKEILAIRLGWQNGLTLSMTYKRMYDRMAFTDKPKIIAEWKKMKKLFGCASAPVSYVNGWRHQAKQPPTQAELDQPISNIAGGRTYGEWAGITGPGKQLRQMLAEPDTGK